jgi:uncharacterized MnhB-related membrane protein
MRDVFDRLHFAAAGTLAGPVLIGVAVALTGFSSPSGTVQTLAALAFLVLVDPLRQVMVNGLFGLALVLLFTLLQAPDVAISMAVVSTIAYPAVLLMTIYRVGGRSRE